MAFTSCKVNFDLRDYLKITNNQYLICDAIHRSHVEQGITTITRLDLADFVGISERSLLDNLKQLQEMGYIERKGIEFKFIATSALIKAYKKFQ